MFSVQWEAYLKFKKPRVLIFIFSKSVRLHRFALILLICANVSIAYSNACTKSQGRMSDKEFLRSITCKSVPNGSCKEARITWPKRKSGKLTIGLTQIQKGFPEAKVNAIMAGIKNAVVQINNLNSSLHLRIIERDSKKKPDIHIFLVGTKRGEKIRNTHFYNLDGNTPGHAGWYIHQTGNRIRSSAVIFTASVKVKWAYQITIEEVSQALGARFDVLNPYYENRTIFSESGNILTKFGAQDSYVMETLYPPN